MERNNVLVPFLVVVIAALFFLMYEQSSFEKKRYKTAEERLEKYEVQLDSLKRISDKLKIELIFLEEEYKREKAKYDSTEAELKRKIRYIKEKPGLVLNDSLWNEYYAQL